MKISRSYIFTPVPEYESFSRIVEGRRMTFRMLHWLWFRITDVAKGEFV